MRTTLDIDDDVLIALSDEDHVFNERAHAWLEKNAPAKIATCPLTENGLVRVLSNPGYSRSLRLIPALIIGRLSQFLASHDHEFWNDDLTLREATIFRSDRILGFRQTWKSACSVRLEHTA